MAGGEKIPMLLVFYFGEAAGRAQQGVSRRLRRWGRAFDEWMAERKRNYQADAVKQSMLGWRRLVRQCGKMPWEMRQEDIENHARWMEAEGYARSTIHCALGIIASFFKWCDEHRVDTACEVGFNPAAQAARPSVARYEEAKLWSREEVEALLRTLRQDTSELGQRELAFFLTRVHLGAPLKVLQHLQWGQIEQEKTGAWVRWREQPGRLQKQAGRVRLPEEAWEAVLAYLSASGRLKGMAKEKYVFAPLAEPHKEVTGSKAEDWVEGKCLSSSQMLANLKLYGRLAGIPEEKLTLIALRHTGVKLKMETGGDLVEMQAFMNSQEERRFTKYRLKKLPQLPQQISAQRIEPQRIGGEGQQEGEKTEGGPPVRRAKPFKPGERVKHGFYIRNQSKEAVRAVLAEDIQGVEEEIAGLRRLARGLLEREENFLQVGEAYSQVVRRLGEVMAAQKQPERSKENEWVERVLDYLDEAATSEGEPPVRDQLREEALKDDQELRAASLGMVEEIATMRLILRNAFRLAMETQETQEYIRLVGLYSSGCVRLVRLLKVEEKNQDRLASYLQKMLKRALDEVIDELGII